MPVQQLQKLLEFLARSLVDDPDSVNVSAMETDSTVILKLRIAKEDIGKVIGKQGRIAKAMRTVLKASSMKYDKKVVLEIAD